MKKDGLKKLRVRSLIQTLWILLSVLLFQLFIVLLWPFLCRLLSYAPDTDTIMMQMSIISSACCLLWCGHLYRFFVWRDPDFQYRQAFSFGNIAAVSALGMGGCIVVKLLMSFAESLVPAGFEQYQKTMEQFTGGNLALTLFYVLLIGPVAEEMIFRGAILSSLQPSFPFWLANVLQALLFGIYHMNFIQGSYAFVLGLVFGLIRKSTGTLFLNILAHILFNATDYLAAWVFQAGGERFVWEIFLAGIISFMGGLWYTILVYRKGYGGVYHNKKGRKGRET